MCICTSSQSLCLPFDGRITNPVMLHRINGSVQHMSHGFGRSKAFKLTDTGTAELDQYQILHRTVKQADKFNLCRWNSEAVEGFTGREQTRCRDINDVGPTECFGGVGRCGRMLLKC